MGDSASSYKNYSLNSITLGNNKLLRTLDARNCPNLISAPDLSGCTNIEEVYLTGTSVTGIKLPNGGVLKILHLPGTVANLTIRNQTKLTTVSMPTFENVTTLWLENVGDMVDIAAIVNAMADGSRVRLTDMNWTLTDESIFDKLVKMRGLTEDGVNTDMAVVSGEAYLDMKLPVSKYIIYTQQFPYLTVTARFYEYDTLTVSSNLPFVTSDSKMVQFTDGAFIAEFGGDKLDEIIEYYKEV